jgi:hypothetical protein
MPCHSSLNCVRGLDRHLDGFHRIRCHQAGNFVGLDRDGGTVVSILRCLPVVRGCLANEF